MVMKKLFVCLAAAFLASGAAFAQGAPDSAAVAYSWKTFKIDSHRTGVWAPNGSNVKEALGTVEKGVYTAPNGKVFRKGSTPAVAAVLIAAQEPMGPVKEVIGYSTREMIKTRPQCELSDWFTDFFLKKTEELTGKHVDVAIYNFGGIRADMPQGDITVDDIYSMFPFNNSLCYVELKGVDLRNIFNFLAKDGMQAFSGAKVVLKDHTIQSITIGGNPLNDRKTYGVATINFLLTGGDGLFIAKNALDLIDSGVYLKDALVPYIKSLTAEGKPIEGVMDDRLTIIGDIEDYR